MLAILGQILKNTPEKYSKSTFYKLGPNRKNLNVFSFPKNLSFWHLILKKPYVRVPNPNQTLRQGPVHVGRRSGGVGQTYGEGGGRRVRGHSARRFAEGRGTCGVWCVVCSVKCVVCGVIVRHIPLFRLNPLLFRCSRVA